jgi:hypothetical protein
MAIHKGRNEKFISVNYNTADTAFQFAVAAVYQNRPPKGVIEWVMFKCRMVNGIITTANISIQKTTAYIITTKEKKPTW